MNDIAIIEKYPTSYDYNCIFPFEFDRLSLISNKKDRVYKKDIQLNIDEIKENYRYLILVGAESCKFVGKISSVTDYQGFLVEDKFIPLINPLAVKMKPSLQYDFDKSISDIINIIEGDGTNIKKEYDIQLIRTKKEAIDHIKFLLDLINKEEVKEIAWDTETSSYYARNGFLLGVSLSYKPEQGVYIDSLCIDEEVAEYLQKLANAAKAIFHNKKFDDHFLSYHLNLTFPDWEDTMLEHYVLDETEGSHGLKTLAIKYTNLGDYDRELDIFKKEYCKIHKISIKDFTYDLIPFDILGPYAALDTAATIEIHYKFKPHIEKNKRLKVVYERLLKEGTEFLIDVEDIGIPIDKDEVDKYINEVNKEVAEITAKLYEFEEIKNFEAVQNAPFNVNSPKQKQELFFGVLGLPSIKQTPTGANSTDAEVIEELSKLHPLPRVVNDIMKLKKIKSTYLEKFKSGIDKDGRLRTGFNLHTTSSGRLSSSGKINAQQLPKEDKRPKKCIRAKKGFKIVSQDLKTAEMYIAAVLSGDKNLQKIFIDGVDYHGAMAVNKFNLACSANEVKILYPDLRNSAKTISFEILYKLNYREPALENFKQLKRWLQDQEKYIKTNSFIYSHFGRKRRLEDVQSPNKKDAQHMVRSGINFLVQSVASDVNLLAGIDMQNWIKENGYQDVMKIFGLVHDSILAEVADEYIDLYLTKLKEFTQKDRAGMTIPGCPIGLDVEIGDSYGTVEEYDFKTAA